jgi:hypothetical protein
MQIRITRWIVVAGAALLAAGALTTGVIASSQPSHAQSMGAHQSMHAMHASAATLSKADLRVTLDRLFGQHAVLAMNATNAGVEGSSSFPATAKALDRNSVALSKAVASIYGAKAGRTFLNGKFMWRDHIRFFVAYTKALAKKDRSGQNKAVANLRQYTVTFGDFLAGATGLPKSAVRSDLLGHIFELKQQLDAYAAGNYRKASATYDAAYEHMFMTGDLIAGAIAKQKGLE